ncbi:MAG TPA: histidine kinase [Candidatus Limnocylindrales bacterium]|nr:histidine kinase [Candidatus Limnocylindrales bacterium]
MPTIRLPRNPKVVAVLATAAAVCALIGASYLLGARTIDLDTRLLKALGALGWEGAWRQRVLWWWVTAAPAIIGLFVMRRRPVAGYALALSSAVAHILQPDLGLLPIDLAAVITLYVLAGRTSRIRSGLALVVGVMLTYAAYVAVGFGLGPAPLVPPELTSRATTVMAGEGKSLIGALTLSALPCLALGIAWALGEGARTRHLHLETLRQRAADLQRERDHKAALAVAAERARIARELHDVVAHGITVMVIQAQAADAALPEEGGGESHAFLGHVISGGRASLAEMRRLLGLIRSGPEGADLAPPPGIAALPDLIDEVRSVGTPVRLDVEGDPVALPAAIDLSAYRIIQEARSGRSRRATRWPGRPSPAALSNIS